LGVLDGQKEGGAEKSSRDTDYRRVKEHAPDKTEIQGRLL